VDHHQHHQEDDDQDEDLARPNADLRHPAAVELRKKPNFGKTNNWAADVAK